MLVVVYGCPVAFVAPRARRAGLITGFGAVFRTGAPRPGLVFGSRLVLIQGLPEQGRVFLQVRVILPRQRLSRFFRRGRRKLGYGDFHTVQSIKQLTSVYQC